MYVGNTFFADVVLEERIVRVVGSLGCMHFLNKGEDKGGVDTREA